MSNVENNKENISVYTYSTIDTETEFENKHKPFLAECKNKGEEDGRRNLPKVDTKSLQPFEKETIEKYQSEISRISGFGGKILQEIYDKNVRPLQIELDDYLSDNTIIAKKIEIATVDKERFIKEAVENHEDKLKEIENEPAWTNASRDFRQAQIRFDKVSERLGRRELHIHIKAIVYIFILIFIGICEIPINYQVFVSFRETPLLTLIMAGVLVISLPLLAHSSGKFLRQYKENKNYLWLLGISIVLISTLSYFTADLRQAYLATKNISSAQLSRDFWIFFIISLILFFVGGIVSFLSHDPSIEFTEVFKGFSHEKRKFDSLNKIKHNNENRERERFNNIKNKIQEDFTKKKSDWDNKIQTLKREHSLAVSEHDKLLAYFQSFEKRINDCCKEAIQVYRDKNLTFRNNHTPPEYWADAIPDLKFYFIDFQELSKNPKKNT